MYVAYTFLEITGSGAVQNEEVALNTLLFQPLFRSRALRTNGVHLLSKRLRQMYTKIWYGKQISPIHILNRTGHQSIPKMLLCQTRNIHTSKMRAFIVCEYRIRLLRELHWRI